jgi:hypothetical protein
MKRMRSFVAYGVAVLTVQGLFGCTVIDHYSGRAIQYNLEAEQAQEQALLLNIVRASLRRPMQFTSLQSVTGSGNVSGSIQGGGVATKQSPYISNFPLAQGGANALAQSTNAAISRLATGNVTGNATMGGTATFIVPVLDTQEFYQGILTPLTLQVVDYYIQQGFPPQLLFDLFVLKVEVTRIDDGSCRKFTFTNSVRDDLQFGQFQAFSDYMIGSGLTAERVNSVTAYGPPIPQPTAGGTTSAADTANLLDAYSKAASAGLDIRQDGTRFRVQKKSNNFRLCFAYPGGTPSEWLGRPDSTLFCGHFNRRAAGARGADTPPVETAGECVPHARPARGTPSSPDHPADDFDGASQGVHADGAAQFRGIRLAPEFLRRIDEFQKTERQKKDIPVDSLFDVRSFAGGVVSFKFFTRSTEGILYYLGEVTRRRLFPEFGDTARVIQVKTGLRYGTMPQSDCHDADNDGKYEQKRDLTYLGRRARQGSPGGSYSCENLFVVDQNPGGDHLLNVSYDGMYFGIPRDRDRSGRTLQVLELIKQLLALNTSAKQLPATGVISITQQ